jgi:disulfide bond formation protein DsbB/mono/diheme cytochrome c family protein
MQANFSLSRFSNMSLYGALLVAWVAMMGSLYFSEVRHFIPCVLCWYQRILMYPLALLIAIGILRRDQHLPYLVLPFSLVGQGLSTYHYLLEKTTLFGAPTACSGGVSCLTQWINWFGFITIPFLAMVAFMLITIFCVLSIYLDEPDRMSRARWQPVLIIVSGVLIAYTVLTQTEGRSVSQAASQFPVATVAENNSAFTPVEPATSLDAFTEGARFYQQACAACHGPEAEGVPGLGNSLVTSEFIQSHDDASVLAMVRAGRTANDPDNVTGLVMPPRGGRPDLTDQNLLVIIGFLRNLALEVQ